MLFSFFFFFLAVWNPTASRLPTLILQRGAQNKLIKTPSTTSPLEAVGSYLLADTPAFLPVDGFSPLCIQRLLFPLPCLKNFPLPTYLPSPGTDHTGTLNLGRKQHEFWYCCFQRILHRSAVQRQSLRHKSSGQRLRNFVSPVFCTAEIYTGLCWLLLLFILFAVHQRLLQTNGISITCGMLLKTIPVTLFPDFKTNILGGVTGCCPSVSQTATPSAPKRSLHLPPCLFFGGKWQI